MNQINPSLASGSEERAWQSAPLWLELTPITVGVEQY